MITRKLFLWVVFMAFGQTLTAQVVRSRAVTLMGSRFDITIVDNNEGNAERNIDTVIKEISRIENLISDWIPDSQVSEVNRNAGVKPVKVDRELFELTKRAIHYAEITGGAFDISFAAMEKIWKFDGSMKTLPINEEVEKAKANVGYKHIVLDSINCTIFLTKRGMRIGFGATGKGYAADRGRQLMEERGVSGGIVNASGDMATWGTQPNGKLWNIGVTNPFFEERNMTVLKLKRSAITTSGSYEKYVEFGGKRYSHIINPRTGYPATGLISATVVGNSAEIANAISTSLMALGSGKMNVAWLPSGYSALLITDDAKIIRLNNFKGKVDSRLRRMR